MEVMDDHELEGEKERDKRAPIMSQRAQRGKSAEMAVQRVRRIDHAILNERSLIRRFHDKLLRMDTEEESLEDTIPFIEVSNSVEGTLNERKMRTS